MHNNCRQLKDYWLDLLHPSTNSKILEWQRRLQWPVQEMESKVGFGNWGAKLPLFPLLLHVYRLFLTYWVLHCCKSLQTTLKWFRGCILDKFFISSYQYRILRDSAFHISTGKLEQQLPLCLVFKIFVPQTDILYPTFYFFRKPIGTTAFFNNLLTFLYYHHVELKDLNRSESNLRFNAMKCFLGTINAIAVQPVPWFWITEDCNAIPCGREG